MLKKFTGVKFKPQEFNKLNKCLGCGRRAYYIEKEGFCDVCISCNFEKCRGCEGIFRNSPSVFYIYDTVEIRSKKDKLKSERKREFRFKANSPTDMVSEYVYLHPIYTIRANDEYCVNCLKAEKGMKDICFWCENDFDNSLENYYLNGNTCESCVAEFKKV